MKGIEEVRKIKQEVEHSLMDTPGVTGVGVGYQTVEGHQTDVPAIIVYVRNKEEVEKKLPKTIQDIPVEIIQRSFIPHSR